MGLALIWSVAAAVLSSPVPVYELDANVGIHAIGEAAAYWENSGFSTREEAARPAFQDNFVAFKNVRENFGFHSESIWVRVNLSNPQVRRARWVLELADPLVDLFEIHIPDGFGNYEIRTGGDMLPFAHRELAYERFAFTLDFEPGETKAIYLFIQPGYSSVELTAYTPHALTEKVHREQLFSGIYFGMLLLAIIYNFFIFSSMRHTAFLDYVIYGLGLLGVMAVVDGYCAQFFLPGYPIVANRLTGVFTAWIGFGGCRFILSYLGAESLSPLLVRFLKLSVYTNATVMGIAAFTPTVVGVPLALVTALMTFPAVLWASIYYKFHTSSRRRQFSACLGICCHRGCHYHSGSFWDFQLGAALHYSLQSSFCCQHGISFIGSRVSFWSYSAGERHPKRSFGKAGKTRANRRAYGRPIP